MLWKDPKIDKDLLKQKREKIQMTNVGNEGVITNEPNDTERLVREYYKRFHTRKVGDLSEIDQFFEKRTLLTLLLGEISRHLKIKIDRVVHPKSKVPG